ncbi:unnamed protein product [Ambrosiozyma monospora]|uniref:Unnamed protein product n=1 Tax=Ambrosiozyma monospora TaxID=43982 RepID=A0ACB5T1G2_AMBMO|nr:unnamed protein product [Ambrosiozyma monospora]
MTLPYDKVVLDIEGTICPISFVKDELFPYFLKQLPSILSKYTFPLSETKSDDSSSNDTAILDILNKFPSDKTKSESDLLSYINSLVDNDIKDPILKQLQGFIWEKGYTTGSILAPLYDDAIEAMKTWSAILLENSLYIYSSGSVKAQKLLFANVKVTNKKGDITSVDLNGLIDDYFDTVNIGSKLVPESYEKILQKINTPEDKKSQTLFLSDNPKEVEAALSAGMSSYIVVRPGNNPLTPEQEKKFKVITNFDSLIPQ